jgi:hypothetical protein
VFDPFTFGPSLAGLAVNIFAVADAVRTGQEQAPLPEVVPTRDAVATHLPFQESAVSVLHRLTYLSNLRMPMSMRGVLWNWPAVYRAARDLPGEAEALQQSYVTAATVGPPVLLDPMTGVFTAIGEAFMAFAHRAQARKPTFDEHCAGAYTQLGSYSAALRDRLAGALG